LQEQRAHFATALHAFNTRRKLVNMVPVTQEQFDERVKEAEQADQAAEAQNAEKVVDNEFLVVLLLLGCCWGARVSPLASSERRQPILHTLQEAGRTETQGLLFLVLSLSYSTGPATRWSSI
jgi:hypothetical protein